LSVVERVKEFLNLSPPGRRRQTQRGVKQLRKKKTRWGNLGGGGVSAGSHGGVGCGKKRGLERKGGGKESRAVSSGGIAEQEVTRSRQESKGAQGKGKQKKKSNEGDLINLWTEVR